MLGAVLWVLTAEGEQFVDWNTQNVGGIMPEKRVHELWCESVKSRNHRGVRSKEISGAGRREGNVKRHGLTIHEVPRSLEHGEGSVAFIEMADFGLLSERAQQAPSPDPQHHLLGNPHFRSAAIEFAR